MTTPAGRHAQPRPPRRVRFQWPCWLLDLAWSWQATPYRERLVNRVRYRATDLAGDVRWYAAKTTRALKRAAVRWRRRDDDNDVPRPETPDHGPAFTRGDVGPGHFGRPHLSGTVHDEPAWYQPHAAPDIPRGFWSPPALRDWLPELLEWALTAPIGEIRAAAA